MFRKPSASGQPEWSLGGKPYAAKLGSCVLLLVFCFRLHCFGFAATRRFRDRDFAMTCRFTWWTRDVKLPASSGNDEKSWWSHDEVRDGFWTHRCITFWCLNSLACYPQSLNFRIHGQSLRIRYIFEYRSVAQLQGRVYWRDCHFSSKRRRKKEELGSHHAKPAVLSSILKPTRRFSFPAQGKWLEITWQK